MKYSIDDPEIQAILSDVYRSSAQHYFRVTASGSYEWFSVRAELKKLHISHPNITLLLREALAAGIIKEGKFHKKRKSGARPKPEEPVRATRTVTRAGANAPDTNQLLQENGANAPKPKDKPKVLPKVIVIKSEPLIDAEDAEKLGGFSRRRFCLIETSTGWYGYWDKWNAERRLLSQDLAEAQKEIDRLNLPEFLKWQRLYNKRHALTEVNDEA